MRKIIYHIRKQPEEVKRHILHLVMMVFVIILVTLWFYSLGTSLTSPKTEAKIENTLQPFSVLKSNIIDGYKSISAPDLNMTNQ